MKKKNISRVLLTALAVLMTLTLTLTGCGGGSSSSNTSDVGTADGVAGTIKIGYVLPLTGPMASYSVGGVGARYIAEEALKIINDERGGIDIGGQKMKVEIIWGDTESDPTKAQEVATKLVTSDKVNILFGEWTPATTSPVSAVAERNKVPAILANGPDTSWLEGGPYDWSFGLFFNYDWFIDEYFNAWDEMDTNKKIGLVLDSNVDGVGMADIMKVKAAERGYTIVDPGRFPEGTKDYMQVLTQIQNENCDILVSSLLNPELVTVWNQCQQLGYTPKTAVLSKGMHLASEINALGEGKGEGLCIETQWSPQFPWINSLNGKDAQTLSDEYEAAINSSPDLELGWDWTLFEVAYDALSRAGSLDPEAIRQALIATDLETTYGKIVFAENHVGYCPIVFGQWLTDEKWGYKKVVIAAGHVPEVTQLTAPVYIPGYNSSK
ncbi:MAG: ABC transporter substrate-binding protein [Clostridiales Family XIII bacterium]|jgi:branched-chain amino acid transport system substrate-binding protein|nr:ABC transporter substrate-binding protein [Clostridiales Family XIII bacterium]